MHIISKLVLVLAAFFGNVAMVNAEQHAEEALKHAEQAAHSKEDSATVQEHATEALKHIDAAKAAGQPNREKLKHLLHGEKDLKDAIEHSRHFNSPSASEEAQDAAQHLEKAK
jgi:hypothetical protein